MIVVRKKMWWCRDREKKNVVDYRTYNECVCWIDLVRLCVGKLGSVRLWMGLHTLHDELHHKRQQRLDRGNFYFETIQLDE